MSGACRFHTCIALSSACFGFSFTRIGFAHVLFHMVVNSGKVWVREFFHRWSHAGFIGRMMILEKVWDYDFDPGTNLVDVYVRRLREKIDADFEPKLLQTVRGAGYVLKETP